MRVRVDGLESEGVGGSANFFVGWISFVWDVPFLRAEL